MISWCFYLFSCHFISMFGFTLRHPEGISFLSPLYSHARPTHASASHTHNRSHTLSLHCILMVGIHLVWPCYDNLSMGHTGAFRSKNFRTRIGNTQRLKWQRRNWLYDRKWKQTWKKTTRTCEKNKTNTHPAPATEWQLQYRKAFHLRTQNVPEFRLMHIATKFVASVCAKRRLFQQT